MVRRVISVRWWLAAAGTALAFGGGALAAGLSPADYRAKAALVVGRGDAPLQPGQLNGSLTDSVAKLLDSNLIAADVIANLRLHETTQSLLRRVDSGAAAPGLVWVTSTDKAALRAEQIAQEITLIFPRLVRARFTGENSLRATVWDPARVVDRPSRDWGTSMAAAAAASAFLWLLAAAGRPLVRLRLPKAHVASNPPSNTVLQAGPGAAHESPAGFPAPEGSSDTVLQAQPGDASSAGPRAGAPANGVRGFNLGELESLVEGARERFPERVDEWQAYVFFLRDHAEIDGSLPANFHQLVADVFAELLTPRR
jgi:hypothetical protein